MNVLVVDVGGSHVKLLASGETEPRRFDSHAELTPEELIAQVNDAAKGWNYEAVSLGVPGRVGRGGAKEEPGNLGNGWIGFDFAAAWGRPVRVVNDAAMQALGAYAGGRMLFLGLGTGLGSALVVDQVVVPLELGQLRNDAGATLADRLGKDGHARLGPADWNRELGRAVAMLRESFAADYVVLGGGHAHEVDPLPRHCRLGGNDDAFAGGFRLWEQAAEPHDKPASTAWRMLG